MRRSWLVVAGLWWTGAVLGMTVPTGTWQPVDRAVFEARYGDAYPKTEPTGVTLIRPTDKLYVYTLGTASTSHCTLLPHAVQLKDSGSFSTFTAKGNLVALIKAMKFSEIGFTFRDFGAADGYATRCLIHAFAGIEPEPSADEKERAQYKRIGSVPYEGGFVRSLDYDLSERLPLKKLLLKTPNSCIKKWKSWKSVPL